MSFKSSHDIKEQVRQATDLVDLVSRSITLRRQGRNYVGLCPWHDDSRPSLQVNPERQSWKCWVCDVGGDVFSFVMKREGVDFREALRMLAEQAGIPWTQSPQPRAVPGSPNDKPTLFRAMAWAEEQFHRCLLDAREAEPARRYLQDRGISGDSVERFHLGFSPDKWSWLLDRSRATPFSTDVLRAAGLLSVSQDGSRVYDRFRGRLIFSIRDTQHRPIAFGARILPRTQQESERQGPKYVNSPETPLFTKSDNLYALDLVRDSVARDRQVVVVEGYTDVIMAHQHGLTHVVAALGTALGERHIRLLRRFAETITLVLDGDEAGQRRTNEILALFLAAQVDLRVLTLPEGLDPCDFLQQKGASEFRQAIAEAVDALEHKYRSATQGIDVIAQPDRAHRALEDVLATMSHSPLGGASAQSMHLREQQMLARLARHFHVEESAVRGRLSELRRRAARPAAAANAEPRQRLTPAETELFEILIIQPELVPDALDAIDGELLTTDLARQIWALYTQAREQKINCEFEQMLTIAEDATLKSLLVGFDEQARHKAEDAGQDAQQRLNGLIRDFHNRRERMAERQTLATLENRGYDDQEELAVLERMIQQERNRQGISAPTDG